MINIRKKCEIWASKTYQEELQQISFPNKKTKDITYKVFDKLQILDIPMDGYSCEKLPKTEENRTGIKRTYSEIFHEEIKKNLFSPATYLSRLVEECLQTTNDINKIVGAVARGLRTLTSLLREPDFANQIQIVLKENDNNVTTVLNSKLDSSDHTDVLLTYKEKEYRIWLYQFSSRGLPHDIERLTGKRGTLPNGTHLICPLHTEKAIVYDKLNKRCEKLNIKLNKYKMDLLNCSEKAVKKKQLIEEKIDNTSHEINSLLPALKAAYNISSNELDIVFGWYFYSDSHIRRITNYIESTKTTADYSEVVKLLTAPENFVGSIHAFTKED